MDNETTAKTGSRVAPEHGILRKGNMWCCDGSIIPNLHVSRSITEVLVKDNARGRENKKVWYVQ